MTKRGCLVGLVLVALLGVYTVWQLREPSRRAAQVRQQIHVGMSYQDVESLLTGRYLCFYQVLIDGGWKMISKDEFVKVQTGQGNGARAARRLELTFLGLPNRTSFYVKIDGDGKVSEMTTPWGWD